MDLQTKTPRKRVANFTSYEKGLLVQLIKHKPIIEAKSTDGKSIAKKQVAWATLTREFNSHANVSKRETITLKRAWDNIKAISRKTSGTGKGNLTDPGGGYIVTEEEVIEPEPTTVVLENIKTEQTGNEYATASINSQKNRRLADYTRRRAVVRIKQLEIHKKLKTQILESRKRAALLEEETAKILLESMKTKALIEEETAKILLEKARVELDILKKTL